jgi:Mn2+/Fe2+ NRAMP family transporter
MFLHGLRVEQAIDMVKTLEPLAGKMAVTGFVAGIMAAGLSSLFPNYVLGPWMFADFMGRPRNLSSPGTRIFVVVTALAGLVVPVFGGRPVQIMIASQAVSPLIMPLMALFTAILLVRTDFVGSNRTSLLLRISLLITIVFSLYMLYLAMQGLWGTLFLKK